MSAPPAVPLPAPGVTPTAGREAGAERPAPGIDGPG